MALLFISGLLAAGLGQAVGAFIAGVMTDPHRRKHRVLRRRLSEWGANSSMTCGDCGETFDNKEAQR